jgi:hypothetical protein
MIRFCSGDMRSLGGVERTGQEADGSSEGYGGQAVAFNFNWRSVSELFGVMFQD